MEENPQEWEDLGLKAGLEIHQQLSGKKLFCDCPAELIEGEPDLVFSRQLRASAGETGTIDIAARAEQNKNKKFTYHAFNENCCLVEMDEEPPHPVNSEAITTAVMVAKSTKSTILNRAQFMRKTIVDGSNVCGFQRTGLIAIGGAIPGLDFHVGIQTIAVEEDAAKIISRSKQEDIYNLSRLGIPLIEIATDPDLHTPKQVQLAAKQLGMILRSTSRVKRGLGTIRQDVNVSIIGGTRIEIKGCQDLRMMPTIVKNEAYRQKSLLEIRDELKSKLQKIETSPLFDATSKFKTSEKSFIQNALKKGSAWGFCVDNFKGILGRELYDNYRVGTELSGLAKSRGFGGIIHSDEAGEKYGVDIEDLREFFNCNTEDAFIVVLGREKEIQRLKDDLLDARLNYFLEGVPKEVRKANQDGTTTFLRPMPGGARMYPETDIHLVKINHEQIKPPKLITEQVKEMAQETGLSEDLARIVVHEGIPLKEYKEKYPSLDYAYLSSVFVEWPREIEKRIGNLNSKDYVEKLLQLVITGELPKGAVKNVLMELAKAQKEGKNIVLDDLLGKFNHLSDEDLARIVKEIVTSNPGLREGAYMGDVMKRAPGADGKKVMQFLKEALNGC